MIKIPSQANWFQSNRGRIFGSIWSSFNLNLTAEKDFGKGTVRTTRMLLGASSASVTNLTLPVAFRRYGGVTYALVGTGSAGRLFKQGSAFTSNWSVVTDTPTNFTSEHSDMEIFNGFLYISEGTDDDIARYDGSNWTEISVGEIGASQPHMMCVYGDRLYVSGELSSNSIIKSMNTAQTVTAVGGTNTITITDAARNAITFLRPVSNGIWIGTVNTTGGKGRVYFWDGVAATVSNIYRLQSAGALAGVVKDDVLYIVDADGRLLAFNGGTFVELDRFPLKENYLTFSIGDDNSRWIHPNGMTVADDRILILIENQYYIASLKNTIEENAPSGIWEWSKETGLYHKYALSHCLVSDAGGGSITDYGQNRISLAGAVNFVKQDATPANDNGTLFAGAQIYTTASANIYGIFIDDLNDTVQKYGYLVTPKILSQNITDTWQKVYVRIKKLLASTDSVTVKYRVAEVAPVEASITWVDTDTFTVTASAVPDLTVGDEVEVVQGDGSGKCAHISSFTGTTTYTVNLDDTFTGVTTNTAKARFQKWKKIATLTSQNEDFFQFPIGEASVWVQLKICLQHTGADELFDLNIINSASIQAK